MPEYGRGGIWVRKYPVKLSWKFATKINGSQKGGTGLIKTQSEEKSTPYTRTCKGKGVKESEPKKSTKAAWIWTRAAISSPRGAMRVAGH